MGAAPEEPRVQQHAHSHAHAHHRAELKRLSHDVRNALNGVAVNLEVARTRVARGSVEPSQVAPFLENAAQQLERATTLHKQLADLATELATELTRPA